MALFARLTILACIVALALVHCASATDDIFKRHVPSRNVARAKCPSAHLIGIRGNSTGSGANDFGLLTPTMTAMQSAIPGSRTVGIGYPRVANSDPSPEEIGRENLLSKIEKFAANCPDTPIVLAGYSLGGIITMNTICSASLSDTEPPLSTQYLNQIIAVVLYGEESRVAGQSYDVGTCNGSGEVARNNANECEPYASIIRSWCDYGDPLCCVGYNNPNENIHKEYPGEYDDALVSYVTSQYENFQQKRR